MFDLYISIFEPNTSVFFLFYRIFGGLCVSVHEPSDLLSIFSSLTAVKVVVLETYFCAKHIKNRIDLLRLTVQSLPMIEKFSANQ